MNYAQQLPRTRNDMDIPGSPPGFPSLQSQAGVPIVSSVLTFTDKSTFLELSVISGQAGSGGIIGKWGTASVTATNFDFFVNSGVTRQMVIPVSVMGIGQPSASVVGANVANGLYTAVALKGATTVSSSVFSSEY